MFWGLLVSDRLRVPNMDCGRSGWVQYVHNIENTSPLSPSGTAAARHRKTARRRLQHGSTSRS